MTQEDKELLLKDLSARLPYEVILRIDGDEFPKLFRVETDAVNGYSIDRWEIMPYLRPMSSMTEEEKKELLMYGAVNRLSNGEVIDVACVGFENHANVQDYLNSHHFDYRGFIEKGLAIEAPEGMYN